MRAIIEPSQARGTVQAPPSKSMAHRMLMGAGLAEGVSHIKNIELSEDIKATLGILKALGCDYEFREKEVILTGIGNQKIQAREVLDCNESGSTLRFFIPLLLTGGEKAVFSGAKRLLERPLGIYEEICKEQGIFFQKEERMLTVQGVLKAAHYKVPGGISSQFITGLLFALPLLKEDSVLEILPPIESRAYIDMTLEALEMYGIQVLCEKNCFFIKGNQTYHPLTGSVEGDYSNAAFLEALNVVGGSVKVEGLRMDSLQGDKVYQSYFERLKREYATIDIAECPDLGPILIAVAAARHGAKFTGTHRLKIKESDRGNVMAQELRKFGIQVDVDENVITVEKGKLQKPAEILSSHNDHRIAMSLAVLCTLTGGEIENCESVRKSFPDFYSTIEKLGIQMRIEA